MSLDRFHPIGTPDELAELDLDPREYFACCAPTGGGIRYCKHWARCDMPFKGKSRQAPENATVYRQSAQSKRVKLMVMPCHRYYDHKQEWEENKDLFHIIGFGGDGNQFPFHETREVAREQVTSQLTGRSNPRVIHEEVMRECPKHPRPREAAPDEVRAGAIRQRISAAMSEQARREFITGRPESVQPVQIGAKDGENGGDGSGRPQGSEQDPGVPSAGPRGHRRGT